MIKGVPGPEFQVPGTEPDVEVPNTEHRGPSQELWGQPTMDLVISSLPSRIHSWALPGTLPGQPVGLRVPLPGDVHDAPGQELGQ